MGLLAAAGGRRRLIDVERERRQLGIRRRRRPAQHRAGIRPRAAPSPRPVCAERDHGHPRVGLGERHRRQQLDRSGRQSCGGRRFDRGLPHIGRHVGPRLQRPRRPRRRLVGDAGRPRVVGSNQRNVPKLQPLPRLGRRAACEDWRAADRLAGAGRQPVFPDDEQHVWPLPGQRGAVLHEPSRLAVRGRPHRRAVRRGERMPDHVHRCAGRWHHEQQRRAHHRHARLLQRVQHAHVGVVG